MEYTEYVELLADNLKLHQLHYKNFKLSQTDIDSIKKLPHSNILVITEPWCGDSLALLPIVKKIAEANRKWHIKIVLRDKSPELMDKFLTSGGRAIPVFLFLNDKLDFIFKWGPRPKAAQEIFDKYREKIKNAEIEKSKVILKIRQYYSKDKGKDTSAEILSLIHSNLK